MVKYLEHPYIRNQTIQARLYQQILFGAAVKSNSLVVLPTGLGKTVIFIMVIAHYLNKYPDQAVIITAPTRPLVNQHLDSTAKMLKLDLEDIIVISGETSPDKRDDLWNNGKVFIATPQTLRNDIISNKINLKRISLICFDEAHRAVGDDPYVLCAQEYAKLSPKGRRLGFTASPGNKEKVYEILENLRLDNFEYMDEDHPHVKPYVHGVEENWEWIDLPENFQEIITLLENEIKNHLQHLKDLGAIKSIVISNNSKSQLLKLPKKLNAMRDELDDPEFFGAMGRYGQLMLLYQASEMLETQGVHTLLKYIEDKLDEFKRTNKSSLRKFVHNSSIQRVYQIATELVENKEYHPKLEKLISIVREQINSNPDSRILVFANYKATTAFLVKKLNELDELNVHRFVGQSSSSYGKGLTQKQQKKVMDGFRSGIYNVLVSTSVGEEGLDVAQCDLVIFYDVTPSATRLIQRSGRTGRAREGEVVILITRGTRDEGYFYASRRQKEKIKNSIKEIKSELHERRENKKQTGLDAFFTDTDENSTAETEEDVHENINPSTNQNFDSDDKPIIYMDHRERGTSLVRKLLDAPVILRQDTLPVADFLLSDRVAIERKTSRDFVDTLMRGDLFDQLIELKRTYLKPMLLLNISEIYNTTSAKAAVQGAISSIMVDYEIPIIFVRDEKEALDMLISIAKREQKDKKRQPVIRSDKTSSTLYEEQIYLLSSLPNINNILAERILEEFKDPLSFFKASENDMKKVHGIGPQIAQRLVQLFSTTRPEDLSHASDDD